MRDATTISGVKVHRVINQPTAAMISLNLPLIDDEKHHFVFDLGATYKLSILSIEEGIFENKYTYSDNTLGGTNFDDILIDYSI